MNDRQKKKTAGIVHWSYWFGMKHSIVARLHVEPPFKVISIFGILSLAKSNIRPRKRKLRRNR